MEEKADACTERGQIGALLKREGLYSSHLSNWRRQREASERQSLTDKKRRCSRKRRKRCATCSTTLHAERTYVVKGGRLVAAGGEYLSVEV